MLHYFPGDEWYALRIKFRHEQIAEKALSNKNFSPLYLTYQEKSKRKDRKKILSKAFFPGYMFIQATLNAESHVEILKSIGVVELLRNSQGPIPIPEEQIRNVMKLSKYSGKVLIYKDFAVGMPVRVIQGPLTGLIGKIDEVQRNLVKISIDSIPGSVAIQVPFSHLEPIESDYSLTDLLRMND